MPFTSLSSDAFLMALVIDSKSSVGESMYDNMSDREAPPWLGYLATEVYAQYLIALVGLGFADA